MNKVKTNFIDQYFRNKLQTTSKTSKQGIGILACTFVFIFVLLIRFRTDFPIFAGGILSQSQVFISIYLTLSYARKGFLLGIVLNILNLGAISFAVFLLQNSAAITGFIVTLFTLLSITIIYFLINNNEQQYQNVMKQKEELVSLNNDLVASNEKLFDYRTL